MGNKDLKMKLGQIQEEISKASLPVSANLSYDFKPTILETDQRKISPFMRLFWEEQQKYLQSSLYNATYHPMNSDTNVTYQDVNLFSSDKCSIYVISDVPHYMKSAQHCLYNSGKGRYTRCMWNNYMFILWNHISPIFYKDRDCRLQILPKLSNKHIKLTPYSKINVRLAAQVHKSVSKVLLAYSPPEAAETAHFSSLID